MARVAADPPTRSIHSRRGSGKARGQDALLRWYLLALRSPVLAGSCLLLLLAVVPLAYVIGILRGDDAAIAVATAPPASKSGTVMVRGWRPRQDYSVRAAEDRTAEELREQRERDRRDAERARADHQRLHENGLSLRPEAYQHLQGLPPFPKIVHLIWNDKDVLDARYNPDENGFRNRQNRTARYKMIEHGAWNLRDLNPDWKFEVHHFDDVDETIRRFDRPEVLPEAMKAGLLGGHIVERTDAFRAIKIYKTGGLYVDIDRVMNANLTKVIDAARARLVLPTNYDVGFAQDLFGSSPGNDLVLNALRRQCEKRANYTRTKREGWLRSSDRTALVATFSESLELDLFGRRIGRPGTNAESAWNEARHVLASHSDGMVVTKKDTKCDGLLVKDYEGCNRISRSSLYKAYNVTSWVKEVDSAWASEKSPMEKSPTGVYNPMGVYKDPVKRDKNE